MPQNQFQQVEVSSEIQIALRKHLQSIDVKHIKKPLSMLYVDTARKVGGCLDQVSAMYAQQEGNVHYFGPSRVVTEVKHLKMNDLPAGDAFKDSLVQVMLNLLQAESTKANVKKTLIEMAPLIA